jgi:hypothetical protein
MLARMLGTQKILQPCVKCLANTRKPPLCRRSLNHFAILLGNTEISTSLAGCFAASQIVSGQHVVSRHPVPVVLSACSISARVSKTLFDPVTLNEPFLSLPCIPSLSYTYAGSSVLDSHEDFYCCRRILNRCYFPMGIFVTQKLEAK